MGQEGSPWTRSTKVVHGPGVRVLSFPQIIQPTRITDHTATLIDNIFINSLDYHTISGNILSDLSDHLPNFLIINKSFKVNTKTKIYKRDYTNFNKSALVDEVTSINWDIVLPQTNDVNEIFDCFYSKVSEVIDNHVPLKKLTRKEVKFSYKPWITQH